MKYAIYKAANRIAQYGLSIASRFLSWPKAKQVTGAGCRKEISSVLGRLGVTKVMVVTGSHVGRSIAPEIIAALNSAGIETVHYSGVKANPTSDIVYEIRRLYLSEGCNGFLAIGGGSAIDAAKGAACLCVRPQKKLENLAGLLKVLKKIPPFVAVPTTAGTGSETTMAAVITDSETRHKYAIMDPLIIPLYAVMDPELTYNLPAKTTSTTGMDALTHAVESYLCVTNQTRDSIEFAEEATVLIFKYLERAYNNPTDTEAREKMMEAAYKAGWSFGRSGVGNVHAIAHTLGGLYDTPHGLANAVLLPIVLEDYGVKAEKKLAKLAELCEIACDGEDHEKAQAFIAEIRAMNSRMGIPETLPVEEKDIPQMTAWAKHEANPTYPVPVIYTDEDFERVIRALRTPDSAD